MGIHTQADYAVIKQKFQAVFHSGKNFFVGQANAGLVAGFRVHIQAEFIPFFQVDAVIFKRANAEFRALQIKQDTQSAVVFFFHLADVGYSFLVFGQGTVAAVAAEHGNAGFYQGFNRFFIAGVGTDGRDDFAKVSIFRHNLNFISSI